MKRIGQPASWNLLDERGGIVGRTGIDDDDFAALMKAADAIGEIGFFVLANDEGGNGKAFGCRIRRGGRAGIGWIFDQRQSRSITRESICQKQELG